MSEEIKKENVTNEYVIVAGENYKAAGVNTAPDSISFVLSDITISDAAEKFSSVAELQVSGSDLQPYGSYKNLVFVSALVDADKNVTVTMKIKNDLEVEVEKLQQAIDEQAVAIADILYGGGEV